ncbi:MAG: ATP phosphoribosyltransferase regulatory subunit [Lachnospiraceae bacterium]|nr:ATP phosphoribosyltransferase regulatory subunit [Lachnospiraceae bacterium]
MVRIYDKITPEGTRDILFEETRRRRGVTDALAQLFAARGYREVVTPTLEFYDVYGKAADYLPQESMYKLTDAKGRLMVLCPDGTVPIARLAATRLAGEVMPLRVSYHKNNYRVSPELKGRSAQIEQSGIELIGASSLRADLEVLEMAARSLETCGDTWRLELCHIGIFRALMEELDAPEATREEVRLCIEQKSYAALSDLLAPYRGQAAAAGLIRLPRLFGGAEVFEEARGILSCPGALESLAYLETVFRHLEKMGLGGRVILDLGLVNQAEYYTGLIFKGYLDGVGSEVLSGGRYDGLLADFGADLPAVGFALDIAAATGEVPEGSLPAPDVVLCAPEEEDIAAALEEAQRLRGEGLVVVLSDEADPELALCYAKAVGAGRFAVVTAEEEA